MKKLPQDQQVEFLRALVKHCVCSIVEHESDVRIACDVAPARVVFSVFVATTDVGLLLGNNGETIDSIRRVMWAACKKTNYKADLDAITNGKR